MANCPCQMAAAGEEKGRSYSFCPVNPGLDTAHTRKNNLSHAENSWYIRIVVRQRGGKKSSDIWQHHWGRAPAWGEQFWTQQAELRQTWGNHQILPILSSSSVNSFTLTRPSTQTSGTLSADTRVCQQWTFPKYHGIHEGKGWWMPNSHGRAAQSMQVPAGSDSSIWWPQRLSFTKKAKNKL